MSMLDQFLLDLEVTEAQNNMHFSLYYVPPEYQPQEPSYD